MTRHSRGQKFIQLHGVALASVLAVIALPTLAEGITYDLVETGSATTRSWNSGQDKHLSDYVTIKCPEQFGDERLLVAFMGFREPSLNADNFITELSATCRRYGPNQGWVPYGVADLPPVDNTKRLFSAKHRTPSVKTAVPVGGNGNFVPIGVHLEVNTNEYVKDISIIYQVSYPTGPGGSEQDTAGMTGLSANGSEKAKDLKCPADFALTGTNVKYSTDSGKIRVFQIECRQLVHRPITTSSVTYSTEGHPWQALTTSSGHALVSVTGSRTGVQVFAPGGGALQPSCVNAFPAGTPYAANLRFAPGSADIAVGIGDSGVAFRYRGGVEDAAWRCGVGATVPAGKDRPVVASKHDIDKLALGHFLDPRQDLGACAVPIASGP